MAAPAFDHSQISLRPLTGPPALLGAGFAVLLRWDERARARAVLAGLDDARLSDLGVTRRAAQIEARKPFWRA